MVQLLVGLGLYLLGEQSVSEDKLTGDQLYAPMIKALEQKYPTIPDRLRKEADWSMIEELRVGTGWGRDNEQRVDIWLMNQGRGHEKVVLEVKTSRADFLREIKVPLKKRPGMRLSNLFYFYAPIGIIKPTEVPPECGLLEFDPSGLSDVSWLNPRSQIKVTIQAPWRDVFPPTWSFICSMYRNVSKQHNEDKLRWQIQFLENQK